MPALVRGVVLGVDAVSCRYDEEGEAINGSAVVESRVAVDGWEAERDGMSFIGYVVVFEPTP